MSWLLIKLSEKYRSQIQLPIEIVNLPKNVVLMEQSAQQLGMEINSFGFRLLGYAWTDNSSLKLELKGLQQKSNHEYFWLPNEHIAELNQQFVSEEEIANIRPDTLFFRIEPKISKLIPVRAELDLSYHQQFKPISSVQLQPDSILIRGAESVIRQLNEVYTLPFTRDNIQSNLKEELSLTIPTLSQIELSDHKVLLQQEVAEFTEGNIAVPLTLINVPDSVQLSVFPKKVNITYHVSLQNYTRIDESDFVLQCDYRQLEDASVDRMKVHVAKQPDEVELLNVAPSRVEYLVRKSR